MPEDPLEKDRRWLIDMRKMQESSSFYNQHSEEKLRLLHAEDSVNQSSTWQYKATHMLKRDMEIIEGKNIWPFTAYSPWPHLQSMPGEMVDISQEEMRYLMYEKKKLKKEDEYVTFEKNLREAHSEVRHVLKPGLSQSVCSPYRHIPLEYFNAVVEGKEKEMEVKCRIAFRFNEGPLEHFSSQAVNHAKTRSKRKKKSCRS